MVRNAILAATAALSLASCVSSGPSGGAGQGFPPSRAAWQSASAEAKSAHARALYAALGTPAMNQAHPWSSADASGTVTVLESWLVADQMICREFADSISAGSSARVEDVACWLGNGWYYVRAGAQPPAVLAPVLAEGDGIYTVSSGGGLDDVARNTGADLAALQALNPSLPDRLAAGTIVVLP